MSTSDPILSKEECQKLIVPSLFHATELKQCSLKLYEMEHYPVAFSLYVLSMEEISKALMCSYGAIGIYSVKKSNLTSHVTKQKFLSISLMIMTLLKWDKLADDLQMRLRDPKSKPISDDELPNEIKEEMTEVQKFLMNANDLKESGFYVDIDEDGEPVTPREVITKESFPSFYLNPVGPVAINEGMISNMEKLSDYYELIMRPDVFSKLFPKTINQQLSESIQTTTKTIQQDD